MCVCVGVVAAGVCKGWPWHSSWGSKAITEETDMGTMARSRKNCLKRTNSELA